MGELVFIGLGLWDERDMTLRALEEARACQVLFAEFYTSRLMGTTPEGISRSLGRKVSILGREQVEDGRLILAAAGTSRTGFLVPGDPMMATTHVDLRLRAEGAGIPTKVIHGTSIFSAAPGLLGLQIYKFGRTTTIPRTTPNFRPSSPYAALAANKAGGLHSLVLLDIGEDGALGAREALDYLEAMEGQEGKGVLTPSTILAVLGRVGSPNPTVVVGTLGELREADLGGPLQCIILPGKLHFAEEEALRHWRTP
jgi:diphthine synthase